MEIKIENLSFGYTKKKIVLDDVSLTIPSNKFTAVIGPNGSGKTTLVKNINKIIKPWSGTVSLDGVSIDKYTPSEMAKMLAYVPQMTTGIISGSVMDTMMLGRRPYIRWKISEEDIDIVSQVMLRLQIEELAQREFNQLSGGQKQTVLIGRALVQSPKVYLFDEPVSFLDVKNQLEIMTIARELVDKDNKTVIMVVHDLNMALRFADEIIVMKDGQVYAQGSPLDVITEQNISDVYGIRAEIHNDEYIITKL